MGARWSKETDLTKEQVEEAVGAIKNRNRFFIGSVAIDPLDCNITRLEIWRTESETHGEWDTVRRVGENVTKDFIISPLPLLKSSSRRTKVSSKKVFIVHGREHRPMKELKVLLKDFGLKPIVLHEQPGGSRTIVEKLEKHSDVGYAFVILTPDDIGVSFQELFEKTAEYSYENEALEAARRILEQSKGSIERFIEFNRKSMQDPEDACKFLEFLIPRARQNVVLEFGYFMGLLGRDRVCCLYKGEVELPSDMHGIVYISFKKSIDEISGKIKKELRAAGYQLKTELPEEVEKAIEDATERLEVETEKIKDI